MMINPLQILLLLSKEKPSFKLLKYSNEVHSVSKASVATYMIVVVI